MHSAYDDDCFLCWYCPQASTDRVPRLTSLMTPSDAILTSYNTIRIISILLSHRLILSPSFSLPGSLPHRLFALSTSFLRFAYYLPACPPSSPQPACPFVSYARDQASTFLPNPHPVPAIARLQHNNTTPIPIPSHHIPFHPLSCRLPPSLTYLLSLWLAVHWLAAITTITTSTTITTRPSTLG